MAKTSSVTQYAQDVLDGKIVAGELVKLACKRHLKDLEHGALRGLWFDAAAAQRAIDFFGFLKHSKGEWAGTPVQLEPWQQFRVGSVYGWKRLDGFRRFRTAYNEVARKNGKTTEMAGIGLYGMTADNEPGAEIYVAATKRDQAKIGFEEAVRMVRKSPELSDILTPLKTSISCEMFESKFEPLSSEGDTLDGLNVHYGLIDEYHAHPTAEVADVIDTGTGARRQPLIWYITTAGFDPLCPCKELRDYAENILRGVMDDDSFFAYIATLDEGDDWQDPANWIKGNPNLGVSVKLDDLQRLADKAKGMPSALNNFLTKRLNIWTAGEKRWLNLDQWDACKGVPDPDELAGQQCWAGMDLSTTTDLSSVVLAFPAVAGGVKYLCRFYLPEEDIQERERRDRVQYRTWANAGLITLTPGNVIDYDYIKADILAAAKTYDLQDLGYDPYNAMSLVQDLQKEGIPITPVRQGFTSMSPPSKEFEKLVASGKVEHGGHKILRWNAANATIETDAAGNIKPSKKKSRQRIDGLVAAIIALDRMLRSQMAEEFIYETQGIREV